MDSLAMNLLPFLEWLLRTTCQASLLIGLVLAMQKLLGRRLGVRGRTFLWLVILVRMALPWAPASGVSVHNLLPAPSLEGILASVAPQAGEAAADSTPHPKPTPRASRSTSQPASASWHGETVAVVLLAAVWLAGVCLLTGWIAMERLRLRRVIGKGSPVTDGWILDLLEECKRLIGVGAEVRVVVVDGLASPALFGLARPRLLLPSEALDRMDRNELRHVFLHELAHLKRRDILIGHVASVLHVLHWFNPVIAIGLRRMRADVELTCDALALSRLEPGEAPAYGRTVIRQIERLLASPQRSILPGLCGDRAQIQQRIAMIAGFGEQTYRPSPLAVLLIVCLACVGLTNRLVGSIVEPPASDWDAYARRNFRTTYQDRHANIQRCCLRNLATGKYLVVRGGQVACDADEPGEMGLWEYRFDEATNTAKDTMYFYSVAARGYLTSDEQGRLAIRAEASDAAACWGVVPRPEGVWLISHRCKDGYLRLDEEGRVAAENFGRDARGYWEVHCVWRVKTSDDPRSNPQWQREHIPGLD